ncbi:A disintegrin and metalloproteinase with thrombospondin motifs 6 isoform X2 [Halyomorpha halys]
MVVETHYMRDNKSKIAVRQVRPTQCHYNGFVKGIDKSRAALSTCYGLAGNIRVPGEEYLIEPSLDENESSEYHVHYVYKRSDIKSNTNATNCGTKGKLEDALKERLEYEMKYGREIEGSIKNSITNIMRCKTTQGRGKRQHPEEKEESEDDACPPCEQKHGAKAASFMEILFVVDHRLEKFFEHDLETYLFTVFNMVVMNFHDRSIGTPIRLKMVRLIYLAYTLPRLDVARYPPSVLLGNFCDWQLEVNPYLESHPNHHDFAIFVTRFSPCQEKILGVANMASLCRMDKTCTVVSEEGLLLANIITHQIGHSLGADHDDGDVGGCAGEEPDGTKYHMNPVMSLSSTEWSICSQHCLKQFLHTRIGWCLSDPPDEHDFKYPDILPGQVYDAIHQCSINFRMRTLACRTGEFCAELFCQITPKKCASTGDPPAPGTPCAKDMWCFNKRCVHRGQRPGAINGEWGPWTPWTTCTRSCGSGIQSRYRACDSPIPYRGGSECVGEWVSYRMCNNRMCSGYATSFRQVQCKMTDKRSYRGRYYMWDSFTSFFEEMKCALVCINELKQVSIRSPVVVDGTPCTPGTNNVCIQGNCRRVGCDYVIDSESKEDGCGKCHGNGTECRIIEGIFNEPKVIGVYPFLKLPIGTSVIFIRELDPSSCYIIIGSSINSTFFLNNPLSNDQLPGQFDCGGASGVYQNKMNIERVFVKGAVQIPITVSIKCPDEINMGMHYQYALPEPNILHTPIYKWNFLFWDECSTMCGGGTQRARAVCIETRSGEVDDKYCYDKIKPEDVIRTCNQRLCVAKWWVGPWSSCECKEGEGIMTRLVLCMKIPSEDNKLSKVVRDRECCNEPKPRNQKPCKELKTRQKREKPKDRDYKVDYYDADLGKHGRRKHWKTDYYDFDYGDHFNPRFKKPSLNVDENGGGNSSLGTNSSPGMRHPKKKKIRRKNRRKYQNRTYRIQDETAETEPFPTKYKISRTESIIPRFTNQSTTNEIEKKDRKKDDGKATMEDLCSAPTTPMCPVPSDVTACRESTTLCVKNESLAILPENDIFLENVFVEHETTTCGDDKQDIVIEPADLGPRLDTGNSTAYKLIVIPIIPCTNAFPLTDYELQLLGDSGYWPVASCREKILIFGDKMFKIISEASRRRTKPPVIEQEDV